jgi:hypothetical protein
MPECRFLPPWFVRDANRQQLAYIYFENEPGRRSAAKLLIRHLTRCRSSAEPHAIIDFDQIRMRATLATNSPSSRPEGPRAMTTLKIIVLGCVLAVIAITLKIRLDTPHGPQPLARAIVTIHLQQMRDQEALP